MGDFTIVIACICIIWLLGGAVCYLLKVNGADSWAEGTTEFTIYLIKATTYIARPIWKGIKMVLPFLGRSIYEEISGSPYPDAVINTGLVLTNEEVLTLVDTLEEHPYDTPSLSSYTPEYKGAMWIDLSAVSLIPKYSSLDNKQIQRIAGKVIQNYFMKNRNTQVDIHFLAVTPTRLYFAVPLSVDGKRYLSKQAEALPALPTSEMKQKPLTETAVAEFPGLSMTGITPGTINLGYLLLDYKEYEMKIPLPITMPKKTCNLLIAGKSGSGKSLSARWYLWQMVRKRESYVFIADYKGGEEYEMLEGSPSYASGEEAIQMIEAFYELFTRIRNRHRKPPRHLVLYIEEWLGLLTYAETKDKKLKNSLMAKIAEILSVGRGLDLGVVLTVQRADASLFCSGSREQFQCVLSFGRCSKEQFSMLGFSAEMEENPTAGYQPGQALALIDGQDSVQEILVPWINDTDEMCRAIRSRLDDQPDIRRLSRANAGGRSTGQ